MKNIFTFTALIFAACSAFSNATPASHSLICVSDDVSTAISVTFTSHADSSVSGEAVYLDYRLKSASSEQSHVLETKVASPAGQWLLRLTVNENINGAGYSNAVLSTTSYASNGQPTMTDEELLTCSPAP